MMITTTFTANHLVAHRQAEIRATGRSIRIARNTRTAPRAAAGATSIASWSLPTLSQLLRFGARRHGALA